MSYNPFKSLNAWLKTLIEHIKNFLVQNKIKYYYDTLLLSTHTQKEKMF